MLVINFRIIVETHSHLAIRTFPAYSHGVKCIKLVDIFNAMPMTSKCCMKFTCNKKKHGLYQGIYYLNLPRDLLSINK